MPTRISIAKPDIVKAIEALETRVFRQKDLADLLHRNRSFWRLTQGTTRDEFIGYLLESTPLKRVRLKLPHRAETLFVWGAVDPILIAASAKPAAYICHSTAMHLHGLTDQIHRTIYANHEQRPLPAPQGPLTQDRVDVAFRRPQRVTSNIADLGDQRVCLLNGKHTGRLGVEEMRAADGQRFAVTGLERTLIDIAVRPAYAGGVGEVLEAYRRAASRVSVNKLAAMLKRMDFVYPYDQVIGFYLDKSGAYRESLVQLFRTREFTIDFYLAHAMPRKAHSLRWRLFFPEGL